MDPVVHFEMPAEDRNRMATFYKKVFGWKMRQLGVDMHNYIVVETTETDENNMVKVAGTINGGFYEKTKDPASNHPSVVISVENLEESMQKIKDAGGTIHGEPQDIPGVGKFASMIDTEGNRVSVLQPLMR